MCASENMFYKRLPDFHGNSGRVDPFNAQPTFQAWRLLTVICAEWPKGLYENKQRRQCLEASVLSLVADCSPSQSWINTQLSAMPWTWIDTGPHNGWAIQIEFWADNTDSIDILWWWEVQGWNGSNLMACRHQRCPLWRSKQICFS